MKRNIDNGLHRRTTRTTGYSRVKDIATQFCDLLLRHRKVHEATMHFEHKPAEVMMVDFAGDNLSYADKASGEVINCPVFISMLP